MTSARSAAERAIGPTWSSVQESEVTPVLATRPRVGFSPVVPHQADGMRIDPPVSEPSASGSSRDASAAPDPVDEPPVQRPASHGLRTAL